MGSSCCRPEESPQPPQRIIVENSESEEGTLTEFNKGSIQNPEENFQNPAETIPEKGTNQRLSQNSTELVPTDGHETSSGEVQDEFRGEEERVEQSISNGNHYESSGIDEEIPAHVPQSQQQQAEYRRTHTFKLPLYSAGGPKGYAKEHEHIEDPFIAPDIGHAIYLTFHEANRGSLTIQFKKETKDVQGRIIGAGILEADAQGFKYKSATSVATNIWVSTNTAVNHDQVLFPRVRQNNDNRHIRIRPIGYEYRDIPAASLNF